MQDNNDILVSVVCITYNHEPYIRQALEGMLNQITDFNYEIIVHDDASTDNTAQIIKEYEAKFPDRIRAIYQKENQFSQGKKPRKIIYPLIKGKYVAYCEGDDCWICKSKLQLQVDYLQNNPECKICIHAANRIDVDGNIIGKQHPYSNDTIITLENYVEKEIGFPSASMVFYKKYYNLQGIYNNCGVADTPIQVYALSEGQGYYIDKVMSNYRVMVPGAWTTRYSNNINKQIEHSEKMAKFYQEVDKETDFKYTNSLKKEIDKYNYNILIAKCKFFKAKRKYPTLCEKFSVVFVVSQILKVKFPSIYAFIRQRKDKKIGRKC